jgi:hypothetical protein
LAPVTRLAAALAALFALACAAPIRTELSVEDEPAAISKVAVSPVRVDPLLGYDVPSAAASVVNARVLVALGSETKLVVVDAPQQANAVLSGVVRRWSERDGSASGVRHPASVWLKLELRDDKGRLIWTGTYEETQAALSEDAGSFPRAWERGFRWVTAEELADYGVRQLVRALASDIASWS